MRLVLVSTLALTLAACQAEAPPTSPVAAETVPAADSVAEEATVQHIGLMAHGSWSRPLAPDATVAAGYLLLMNHSAQPETLVAASAEGVGRIEIHDMVEVDGVMQMRPIEGGITIDVNASVTLSPGGKHLMFLDVSRAWTAGETIPVTLEFASGQTLAVDFPVRDGAVGDYRTIHPH